MKASVVVPSRGGRDRLPRLLRALQHQTHTDLEVIVVIDGDIDGSQQVVEEFAGLPVRCLVFPSNRGRASALNAGFEAASGDVLIRADDDFEPSAGHVAAHVAAHASGPCGAVGLPRNVAPDNAYLRAYGNQADQAFRGYAYGLPADERWRVWGGNVSVSRETYERVGGHSTAYSGYGWEDLDFGYRVHRLGLPIVLLPDAEVTHHMAAVTTEIRALRAFDSGRARATFDRLHGAGTSGPAQPDAASVWNRAVIGASRRLTRDAVASRGRLIDRALGLLPRPIGRKAVALLVESAAVAGYRVGRQEAVR